jgi:hypothetical protein
MLDVAVDSVRSNVAAHSFGFVGDELIDQAKVKFRILVAFLVVQIIVA